MSPGIVNRSITLFTGQWADMPLAAISSPLIMDMGSSCSCVRAYWAARWMISSSMAKRRRVISTVAS